tara:strand:+ start:228 stop:521 length:294 start_codon:yes stop_codon:yes gene_type:complete
MNEYFRINIIPCYKPWRWGENPLYTKDPEVFKYFNELEDLYGYKAPETVYKKSEEDFDSYDDYERYREETAEKWHENRYEEVEFPITIIDECWVYTE